jgi:hypothetical protein
MKGSLGMGLRKSMNIKDRSWEWKQTRADIHQCQARRRVQEGIDRIIKRIQGLICLGIL